MRPVLSINLSGEQLNKALDAYDAGVAAFKDGVEHNQENFPEEFYSEWSDGWIDALHESQRPKQ